MKIDISVKNQNKLSFAGFQHKKSVFGTDKYEFNLPYDSEKYTATLEIYAVKKNEKDEYVADGLIPDIEGHKERTLHKHGTQIDLKSEYNINSNEPFAYRYKLTERDHTNRSKHVIDGGLVIESNEQKYNLVTQLGSKLNKGGSMLLVIPDSYNVGFVYDENGEVVKNEEIKNKAIKSTKTFSNKEGGTLAGIEKEIPELQKKGYSRIISTPIFTDDSLSAHSYWIKNAMQMTQSLGNINNYASFQKELFKAGMNFIADGAFVNEGLEGIHFKDVLKWSEASPYYKWFKASGIENGPLGMGVFSKNTKFINHKIVNSPYKYSEDKQTNRIKIEVNRNYNKEKPTYVQIFDERLVSDKQRNDSSTLIKAYDKLNAEHHTDINTHNDTIIPYSFIINPETYNEKIETLNEYNKENKSNPIHLGTYDAARFLTKASTFELEEKFEGGFEAWDANTDIAKLNYVTSPADIKGFENLSAIEKKRVMKEAISKNFEVQDFAITAGRYWTKKTNDILLEYVAQTIGNVKNSAEAIEEIEALIDAGKLPKTLKTEDLNEAIKNVFTNKYELKTTNETGDAKKLVLSGLMSLPLDSIEFGDDIVSVLGYPYITNRANNAEDLGNSTYTQYKNGRLNILESTKEMYTNQLLNLAEEIIKEVDEKLPLDSKILHGENEKKTETFRKYVLPLASQEITKFAVLKAICPDAEVKVKHNGEISYDYNKLKTLSLNEIGIEGETPEEEAEELISKIKAGINNISKKDKNELINALYNKFKHTNANSFKLSEMILDRTQSGLDWRIDATKDIADIDSIRNNHAVFSETWEKVISFWKNFTQTIHQENPNSYLAAEITDVWDLHGISGKTGRFTDPNNAENKFLQETGINTTANYSYFFTDLERAFGKTFEHGWGLGDEDKNKRVYDLLAGDRNYLQSAQLESLLFSYTFAGNHDKPRALHCLALDMELFFTDLTNPDKKNERKLAAGILKNIPQDKVKDSDLLNIDFYKVSNKAIAMGETVKRAFTTAINEEFKNNPNPEKQKLISDSIGKSIADLAKGHYLTTKFSPDVFGTKPFDVTIDMVLNQAKTHGLDLSENKRLKSTLVNKTFENMLQPAMKRLEGLMGFLVALPGNPTLFAGDELGLTGYDEKCKNVYLQNRSYLNWDILNDGNKDFLNKFYNKIKDTMELRNKPELAALNTGAPYALKLQDVSSGKTSTASGILRQNSDGKMVISIFNSSGVDYNHKAELGDSEIVLNKISLNNSNDRDGIKGGLVAGTTFVDINHPNGELYVVCKSDDEYFIKKFKDENDFIKTAKSEIFHDNEHQINIKAPNLILYSKPNPIKFTGKKILYNPQYRFVSNPYQQAAVPKLGEKLFAQSSNF